MIRTRYKKYTEVHTHLNQLEDLIDWLGYLTSSEYLIDILINHHGLTLADAKTRASKIIPHVKTAISLINQSLNGPQDVSFLPAYYAILDLAKVYILLGPRHTDLPRHRWHGATYDVTGKDSHSLLTESITLKKGGALALFYETLTGRPITRERIIKMQDIYPYIRDISAEYSLSTGYSSDLRGIEFTQIPIDDKGNYHLQARVIKASGGKRIFSKQSCPILSGFSKEKGKDDTFISPIFSSTPDKLEDTARQYVDCRLLYHNDPTEEYPTTAITSNKFPLTEEFPIALLFFHMSSVVRYKPEFLERLQRQKYWPILATAKRHSLLKFLLLFWSFIHNEQFILRGL